MDIMYIALLLTQSVCFVSAYLSILDDLNLPCKITDFACIDEFVSTGRAKVINGIPELKIETSDPLFFDEVDGDLPNLKYKFFNTTLIGYKECVFSNLKLLRNITGLQYDLNCPKLSLSGKYEMKGELVTLPVEGNGDFELITGKYFFHVNYKLEKYQGKDGKLYINANKFNLTSTPQSPLKFEFKNLFNGQKDRSDAVLKFAHDNWRKVADILQEPIWYACIERHIRNVNKFLGTVPLEEIIVY